MKGLIFKETSITLSTQDDCFLTDISHLILEISCNGRAGIKIDLFSREENPGVWNAGGTLTFRGTVTDIKISVSMDLGGNEPQLLGSRELDISPLYGKSLTTCKIPLMPHENYPKLVVNILGVGVDDIQRFLGRTGRSMAPSHEEDTFEQIENKATDAFLDYERLGDLAKLELAIVQFQRLVDRVTEDDPRLPFVLNSLGASFLRRFERLGDITDLNNAIVHGEKAVDLIPDSHSDRPMLLTNLGNSLTTRFLRLEEPVDLEKAINSSREAIKLTPDDHPNKPGYLYNLGRSLSANFTRCGDIVDLDNAISSSQMAIDLVPNGDVNKPLYLASLGQYLLDRFKRTGIITDINDAVTSYQAAVDYQERASSLSHLGHSLRARFKQLGNLVDIDDSITSFQAAINLIPDSNPHKPEYLSGLGNSLTARFERTANIADIDKAIASNREAVNLTTDGHSKKPDYLVTLGVFLFNRFKRSGNITDLDDAMKYIQIGVDLIPDGHPQKPSFLNNLGTGLTSRFERFGDIADIDNAVKSNQAAVNLMPDGDRDKLICLRNLGSSLCARFERLGNPVDIDGAVEFHKTAASLTPDGHPNKPNFLDSLAHSLLNRSGSFGNIADLDDAIASQQVAINLTPDGHPQKPARLNNLGLSLNIRYKRFRNITDVDNAIASGRAAVNLILDDHPHKYTMLNNLGKSLQTRFSRLENLLDLDNAISTHQAAIDLTPDGHPNKPHHLNELGYALSTRFFRLGNSDDAQASIFNLSAAATSKVGSPIHRFRAARSWTSVASHTQDVSLLTACECAINLMPLVAWLGLPIKDRHEHLVEIGGFTREVGAVAISCERYDKALEWLDQGRSIVWSQILQLRTPIDELHDINPELAGRLAQVSRLLDQATETDGPSSEQQQSVEEKSRQYRALTMERESLIDQARALPNFEDFLRPLSSLKLLQAATDGPIVVFNLAQKRCDGLALIPGLEDVMHIPLPNITPERITELGNEFKDMLYSSGVRMRGERAAKQVEEETDGGFCEQILAELWTGLVRPVLDSLAFSPNPDTLPRIWWCATGPLAFLPIHAAGIYDSESVEDRLFNYAISSYIPTISTLLQSPRRAMNSTFKLLSVIQPSAPGASSIPNTKEELKCIRNRLADRSHVVLEGGQGTKKRVTKGMQDCNWLHLACHGVQKPEEPTKSALILEDGHLTLEEIIRLDLPNAELAFLSACQTTAGDEKLSEEAVHIAGGMLLAGYRGVVATMWSIQDDLAPEVADEFYAHLTRDGRQPDSRKAAEALHFSVQKLRKKKGIPLISWIPFVHLGI